MVLTILLLVEQLYTLTKEVIGIHNTDDKRRAITVSRRTKIQTDSDSARRGGVPFDILSLKF